MHGYLRIALGRGLLRRFLGLRITFGLLLARFFHRRHRRIFGFTLAVGGLF